MDRKNKIRIRNCHLVQYEFNPKTGEKLFDISNIENGLKSKSILRYAYICHDKDLYFADDEAKNSEHKERISKPRHWHVVIEFKSNIPLARVARMFDVPENCVKIPKGPDAFMDNVEYLTHERYTEDEKHLYSDDEITANFDFRKIINEKNISLLNYGKKLKPRDYMRAKVLYEGMTLKECQNFNKIEYMNDMTALKKYRLEYIDTCEAPKSRINYYVEGRGGIGKGLICKVIARALVDRDGKMDDEDIFFEVGADKTSFEGYDGQPVIIWNDCRAFTLLQKLGGRENVFNVFDPFPPNIRQNIKYGSVRLNNIINIVNSVQPWEEFLDGLSGEYVDRDGERRVAEDKGQSYRRFPFFLVLHEEDYDFGMNKGVFEGSREYTQFLIEKNLRGNMQEIATKCGDNLVLYNTISKKAVLPVVEKHDVLKSLLSHEQIGTDEAILEEFKDVGLPVKNNPVQDAEFIDVTEQVEIPFV